MATVPTLDFRADDLLEGGNLSAQKVADALNRTGRAVREALTHGITAENLRVQTVDLTIQTGADVSASFPLPAIKLAGYMPAKPSGVRVIHRQNLTDPTVEYSVASGVDWRPAGERQVSIRYVSGLWASTKHVVTLLIEG